MSKGLEAFKLFLDDVERCVQSGGIHYIDIRNKETIEKELKALEIIKKKQVNIFVFYVCCGWHNPSNYNDSVGCPVNCELTQEEYNLLKEVLYA